MGYRLLLTTLFKFSVGKISKSCSLQRIASGDVARESRDRASALGQVEIPGCCLQRRDIVAL